MKPPVLSLEEVLRTLKDPSTTTLDAPEVACLLGISRPHCYQTIAETGSLGGLPVIRMGHRIKIPAGPVRLLLSIETNPTVEGALT